MNRSETKQLARELMEEHLDISGEHRDWKFTFNTRARSMGLCHYGKKTISISTSFLPNMSDEQVRDTLLHEIAHVLAGPEAGHGRDWQEQAAQIGAIPKATASVKGNKPHKWAMMFNHELVKGYYRKPSQRTFDRLSRKYIVGRYEETYGKLRIVKFVN